MTAHLVDSNVFIQARNLHYGFDFCPAFRDWLLDQNVMGMLASIEKVAEELQAGDDHLAEWAAAQGGDVGKDRVPFVRIDDVAFDETRQGLAATWLSGASIADGQVKGTVSPPGTGGVERRFDTCGLAGDPESTPASRAPLEAGIGLTFAAMGFTFARR